MTDQAINRVSLDNGVIFGLVNDFHAGSSCNVNRQSLMFIASESIVHF